MRRESLSHSATVWWSDDKATLQRQKQYFQEVTHENI